MITVFTPKWASVETLIMFTFVFLHFMIFRPFGFPLTIAPFSILFFLFFTYQPIIKKNSHFILKIIFFLLLPLIFSSWQVIHDEKATIEFIRTYLLWSFNIIVILAAIYLKIVKKYESLPSIIYLSLCIISFFVIAQVGLLRLNGSTALYNLFGPFQYMGEYRLDKYVRWSIRGPGLFLEPSFCAFVIISLWTICKLYSYKLIPTTIIAFIAIVFTTSMSGILSLMLLVALVVIQGNIKSSKKKSLWFRILLFLFAFLVALLSSDYIIQRIVIDPFVESSSSYYRLIGPLAIIKDVLNHHPFGVPFGQMETFVRPYSILNGAKVGTSIDNAIYLIIFYFGWIGLFPFILLVLQFFKSILAQKKDQSLVILYVVLSFCFSGGILLPEYAFVLMLIIYSYRIGRRTKKINIEKAVN